MHQPGKALIPKEVKTCKRASSSPCRQGWGWHNGGIRKPLLTNTITGVVFYLSVKVYFCYSNLASILIHAECITRALGNNPESNFGIQIIWFICISCIYPHYNCTWKTQTKIQHLFTPPCTGIYLYCNVKDKSILLYALHDFLMLLTLFNAWSWRSILKPNRYMLKVYILANKQCIHTSVTHGIQCTN